MRWYREIWRSVAWSCYALPLGRLVAGWATVLGEGANRAPRKWAKVAGPLGVATLELARVCVGMALGDKAVR